MVENWSEGLVMLGTGTAGTTVAVTREEHHQDVLARYPVAPGGQRHVAVELGWCVIGSGKYRGEHAIEVRLDSARVGELTYAMSQRYGPLVAHVAAQGGRPGCEAVIREGNRGLEMVLRLPRDPASAVPGPPPYATAPMAALPPAPAPRRGILSRRPLWIAAAVVLLVVFFAAIVSPDEPTTTGDTDGEPDREVIVATATTTPSPTTPRTTPTTASVATKPSAPTTPRRSEPEPQPQPKPQPQPEPQPEPRPAPGPECDPNYTGCVPVASDVDCAGGSGNGPAYVAGPVRVVGSDIYRLDHDNDGTACE
ncbi:hypothetical protein B0I33_10198 [Prauserella shujinwangii]|uniref:Excalibur calcium-binding domain-containing protein n=1 Tax=Prauserella shujinwangii TaxID=1453103 RepID=A0A2T0M2I6_9PSEU|nr:hypothetical protein [Prauserella shujinwangii]PRX50947.1 hypothetical protein B0I33_10198 [Prauserella shujinwangii]